MDGINQTLIDKKSQLSALESEISSIREQLNGLVSIKNRSDEDSEKITLLDNRFRILEQRKENLRREIASLP
jgi:predicted  nucleic acid-binding Zn-ribbon protein